MGHRLSLCQEYGNPQNLKKKKTFDVAMGLKAQYSLLA